MIAFAFAAFVALVAVGCAASEVTRPASTSPASAHSEPKTLTDILPRTLRGVLLVVNERQDGRTGFGAALLLPGNFALTNLHVVEQRKLVSVMFYDPARPSHGGLEEQGGLRRYLFENETSLVEAWVVREDNALDLAVLQFAGDTSRYPRLTWREEPARPGEKVFAVGHPGQNVWSFTSGLVSNTHVSAIQVDLAINEGNSGGPLLDAEGRVLGINTLRALGNVHGIGYARPIAMARTVIDGVSAGGGLDLSSPEKASLACAQAAESASEGWADCEALDVYLSEVLPAAQQRAREAIGSPAWLTDIIEFERMHPRPEDLARMMREARVARVRRDATRQRQATAQMGVAIVTERRGRAYRALWDKVAASERERVARAGEIAYQRIKQRSGPVAEEISQRLGSTRVGQRIDRVVRVDADHAWLAVSLLHRDGTRAQISQLWRAKDAKWQEILIAGGSLARTRPTDFPPPVVDYDAAITFLRDKILWSWALSAENRDAVTTAYFD